MITVPLPPPPDRLLSCPDLSADKLANELEVDPQQIVLFLDRSVDGFQDVSGECLTMLLDSSQGELQQSTVTVLLDYVSLCSIQ
eukprot:scaffold5629_cov58-Cylindrotheca_fusiformis.AAC.1